VPQGTFAERIRAGGAGLGGFLTPTGIGTLAQGEKPLMEVDGKQYLLERPLRADVALVKAAQADRYGNLVYRRAGRNFNPLMATAADLVVAEVEEIVDELDPELIGTPAVYVDRVVQCAPLPVRWTG
jgi:acetate CoA/acetoacetate CoA-transferase alpha subunit